MNPATIPTPAHCVADFCLIPIGTGSPSVSAQIADVQRLIETCGLKTPHLHQVKLAIRDARQRHGQLGPEAEDLGLPRELRIDAGAATEGPWDRVHQVIGQAHTVLHQQGIVRIQTDIRVGSRTDKTQSFEDKVSKVRELLAKD
ncbi:uncharacterized protein N7511_001073 [Penicillium nucicola]|uniref:uncharacterized protein n=1 Tax=Penicillium nucicola TaxID=1850975 RepID=UPI002545690E|nr:uncharacterized protein N7511_001073 [Penicillium nucicola]KAJ5776062.1 hypothetical protein N7511_001073 [Penicillium nucicola]